MRHTRLLVLYAAMAMMTTGVAAADDEDVPEEVRGNTKDRR